jgi:hypothetical protein
MQLIVDIYHTTTGLQESFSSRFWMCLSQVQAALTRRQTEALEPLLYELFGKTYREYSVQAHCNVGGLFFKSYGRVIERDRKEKGEKKQINHKNN